MTISITDVLNMNVYVPAAQDDNPFPVGIWKAARTQVTDASGGVVRWVVTPPSAKDASKYLWSLEQASWLTSVAHANDYGIYVEVSTGEVISRAGGSEIMRFAHLKYLSNGGGGRVGLLASSVLYATPLNFIHQPGGGNFNEFIMESNNINAEVHTFAMWGYFWNSQARRLASGPRRP